MIIPDLFALVGNRKANQTKGNTNSTRKRPERLYRNDKFQKMLNTKPTRLGVQFLNDVSKLISSAKDS